MTGTKGTSFLKGQQLYQMSGMLAFGDHIMIPTRFPSGQWTAIKIYTALTLTSFVRRDFFSDMTLERMPKYSHFELSMKKMMDTVLMDLGGGGFYFLSSSIPISNSFVLMLDEPRACAGRHVADNALFINICTILWALRIEPEIHTNIGSREEVKDMLK